MFLTITFIFVLLGSAQLCDVNAAQRESVGDPPPRQFIPSSIDEALRELRHTQAKDGGWRGYTDISSVSMREHGHSEIVGDFDEKYMLILTDRNEGRFTYIVEGGGSQDLPAGFDLPFLDASNATAAGSETVTIAGKSYTARIFEFVDTKPSIQKLQLVTTHRFWLVPGIPDGVARHDLTEVETNGDHEQDQRITSRSDRLTDLDVRFDVGGTEIHTYCINSEERERGGRVNQERQCFSSAVPGSLVHGEIHSFRGGNEIANKITDATEFERHTKPPTYAKDQPCTYPALLMERIALEKHRRGDYAGAIRDFDSMIALNPNCPTMYNNRGNSKMNLKDLAGAFADYSRAISLAPEFAEPYNNRGLVQYKQGHYDKALNDYDKAVKLKPDFAAAYANRAIVEITMFRDNASRRDYLKAIELNSDLQTALDKEIDHARKSR
jgi:Flp pilus assembly protein TadD